jgi:hypothetical protein
MWIRRPNPFKRGILIGVALIFISMALILISLLINIFFLKNLFMGGLHFLCLGFLFILGWLFFLTNVRKYVRPFGHCPICGNLLAWDAAYRAWFCHHCLKKYEPEK